MTALALAFLLGSRAAAAVAVIEAAPLPMLSNSAAAAAPVAAALAPAALLPGPLAAPLSAPAASAVPFAAAPALIGASAPAVETALAAAPASAAAPSAAAAAAPALNGLAASVAEPARASAASGLAAGFDGAWPAAALGGVTMIHHELDHGHYRAIERDPSSGLDTHSADFGLEDGVLRVLTRSERPTPPLWLRRDAELALALETFGRGVRAVGTRWEDADLAEFNRLTASGLSAEEAAARSWVGRGAAAAGFTRVVWPSASRTLLASGSPGAYGPLHVLFARPQDVIGGEAHPWRRTSAKTRDGVTWESYEGDGGALWLKRVEGRDEVSVYEFADGQREEGTPAKRMAVFSLKDGRVHLFLSAPGHGVLDERAEMLAALARYGSRATGIAARWNSGNGLAEFKRLVAGGVAPAQAALRSRIGRLAAEAGFTHVVFAPSALENLRAGRPGEKNDVVATFVRP